MNWSRRDFLAWVAASGAMVKSTLSSAQDKTIFAEKPKIGFSILQGMTDETSAQFTVVLPKNSQWTIQVTAARQSAPVPRVHSGRVTRDFSAECVHKITADNLLLGESYWLRVLNSAGEIKDQREFTCLNLSPRNVRLALISCALDHLHRDDVWRQLARQQPELALFVGDNVYCDRKTLGQKVDVPDPQLIWERYVATRQRVAFYFQKKLTPVLAIWDDHDFGGNNSSGSFPYTAEVTDIFNTFFAQDPRPALVAGPGIARRLSAFGADFFMLDGRTFRGEPKARGATLLGQQQDDWLAHLLRPRATLLLNGSLFFGAYGEFESFEGDFSEAFEHFLARVKASGALAAFISGDVHYSEIMDIESAKLGYSTFELVTSSIHSFTFPGHHNRYHNPRRREADSSHNFLIFEGEFSDNLIKGHVTCWAAGFDPFDGPVETRRP